MPDKVDVIRFLTKDLETPETELTEKHKGFVIVGANGSGKSRLWFSLSQMYNGYSQHGEVNFLIHTIPAKRNITLPEEVILLSEEDAQKKVIFGYNKNHGSTTAHYMINEFKYRKNPFGVLEDFPDLMNYLVSEDYKIMQNHIKRGTQEVLESKLTLLKNIWNSIFEGKNIISEGFKLFIEQKGGSYPISLMSDGEKNAFYMIGQCLSVPSNTVIIIDEPELHMHKSTQNILWDLIQKQRKDCLFIYITHDIDFAVNRNNFTKIWLKSLGDRLLSKYDSRVYAADWEIIQQNDILPEELIIRILGTRKNIMFIEGTTDSLDYRLYKNIFSEYYIIPRGSCEKVIESVKAFRNSQQLHYTKAYGIIDRDRRTDDETLKLKKEGMMILDVAEVDNIFCLEEILKICANAKHYSNQSEIPEIIENSKNHIFKKFKEDIENQIIDSVNKEINHTLNNIKKSKSKKNLIENFQNNMNNINIEDIYDKKYKELIDIYDSRNYIELLRVYNRKGLSKEISANFGEKGDIADFIIRLTEQENYCQEIKDIVLNHMHCDHK